jgi:AraC family transcriptional activator of mtrCDE
MKVDADIFRGLAPLLRVRPELQVICQFGAQWEAKHVAEPQGWAPFHIADRVGVPLAAGEVAVLPRGGAHTIRSLPGAAGSPTIIRVQRRLYDELLLKTNVDGEADTKLICGRLCFEHARDNMVLAALPPVVVVGSGKASRDSRLGRIVDAIRGELEEERLGGAAIAAALASSLMLIVFALHFEREQEGRGILALLSSPQTAKALAAIVAAPARAWTLDDLADAANTSRATLVRLFQKSVQVSPLAFLADLRLTLARHRIRTTAVPNLEIAAAVGYQSETAFSRAYRRRFAITPGQDRKDALGGVKADPTRAPIGRGGAGTLSVDGVSLGHTNSQPWRRYRTGF